jgi:bifunctional DNase/RNase
LTYAETAAQLGIEMSAVKTRLHKARRALRRQLEDVWKEMKMPVTTEMNQSVQVRVADVRRKAADGDQPAQFIVILDEIDGERFLPIWIGEAEATQVALQLEKLQFPRPPTIAFAANLLKAVGGRVREVVITKLDAAEIFYAVAVVDHGRKQATVDARPSDALNLALSVGAPISVEPAVFEAAAKCRASAQPEPDLYAQETQSAKDIAAEVQATWKGPGALARQP